MTKRHSFWNTPKAVPFVFSLGHKTLPYDFHKPFSPIIRRGRSLCPPAVRKHPLSVGDGDRVVTKPVDFDYAIRKIYILRLAPPILKISDFGVPELFPRA